MIIGMSVANFTLLHVLISLVGIVTGAAALGKMIAGRRLGLWNTVFLVATAATASFTVRNGASLAASLRSGDVPLSGRPAGSDTAAMAMVTRFQGCTVRPAATAAHPRPISRHGVPSAHGTRARRFRRSYLSLVASFFMRMSVGSRRMFMSEFAMFVSRSCVLRGFLVLAYRVMVLGLMMMMRSGVVVGGS
jgi:hypothetical protein